MQIVNVALRKQSLLVLALLTLHCTSPQPPSPQSWFTEVATSSNITFQHIRAESPQFHFPEIMGGGAAWIDYDQDGWIDLYLVQSGDLQQPASPSYTNKLYKNLGDGSFADVTEQAGVGDTGYGMGAAVADIDNDGDPDLYVTNVGPNVLYINDGAGSFTKAGDAAGVSDAGWGTSAAFVDIDRDGRLDLYVTNYVNWSIQNEVECFSGGAGRDYCHPENYRAPAADVLYKNLGEGRFASVELPAARIGNGLGVVAGDFSGDGWPDIYVANDGEANVLWVNDGEGGFADEALARGVALNRQGAAEAGMGVVAIDVESDGDLDIFLAHLREETNTMYRNQDGMFTDVTGASGLAAASIPLTGFGIGAADFNRDGWMDLFIANGRVGRAGRTVGEDPFTEPSLLFSGQPDGRFKAELPPPEIATSRAVAQADYDNDGDVDLVVVNNGGPVHLYRNDAAEGAWLGLDIEQGMGARVEIRQGERVQWRLVQTAGSYLAAGDARLIFRADEGGPAPEVTVHWPDGTQTTHPDVERNTYNRINPTR